MFRFLQKSASIPPDKEAFYIAGDALENEIIALMDIMDILRELPLETPVPYYLVKRLDVHIQALDERYGVLRQSL